MVAPPVAWSDTVMPLVMFAPVLTFRMRGPAAVFASPSVMRPLPAAVAELSCSVPLLRVVPPA